MEVLEKPKVLELSYEGTVLTADDLEGFELVQEFLVKDLPGYEYNLRKARVVYDELLLNPKVKYRAYQPEFAAEYATRKLNICGAAQGTGKTTLAGLTIATVYENLKSCRPGQVHIVVPSLLSAATRWIPDLTRIPALEGLVEVIKTEKQIRTSTKPIWIYHMDFLKRKSKVVPGKLMYRSVQKANRMAKFLIVDEVHHLKKNTKRTNAIKFIRRKSKRVLVLSGTLSDGRLDLINDVCELVYRGNWPYVGKQLRKEYGLQKSVDSSFLEGSISISEPVRYLNQLSISKIPDWFELINSKVHRVKLSDPNVINCVTYPEPIYSFEEVDMCVAQTNLYQSVVAQYRTQLNNLVKYAQTATNIAAAFKVMQPLARASNLPGDYGVPNKAVKCLELINKATSAGKKTIVFTDSNAVGFFLKEYLTANTTNKVIRMYASDPQESPKLMSELAREEAMNDFLFDPTVMVGIFSVRLASESIDLTSAGQVIFYDLPWQTIKVQQAIARAVRPGSEHTEVDIRFLVNKGTTDIHRSNLLQQKVVGSSLLLDFDVDSAQAVNISPIDAIKSICN